MDCARVSTDELENLKYIGRYKKLPSAQTIEDCQRACVSDLNCKAWSFRTLGFSDKGTTIFQKNKKECLLADKLIPKNDTVIVEPSPLTKSGLVNCVNIPDYAKIMLWLVLCLVILTIVWYFLNVFEPEKFKKHENLFPSFSFMKS